jgi:hypothetical protein
MWIRAQASGDVALPSSIEIVTPLASVRDVGTQFEVRLVDADTLLRVREGSVWLTHAGGEVKGRAGEQLQVAAGGGLARRAIASADPVWDWVQVMASAPEIDTSVLITDRAKSAQGAIRYDSPETERERRRDPARQHPRARSTARARNRAGDQALGIESSMMAPS